MEPAQVPVEVSGCDAAAGSEEVLEPGMSVVDGLDVEFSAGSFAGGLIECLVANTQGRGAGRIAGGAIGYRRASLSSTGARTAWMASALTAGNAALTVAPDRSAATRTGTCSRDRPRSQQDLHFA